MNMQRKSDVDTRDGNRMMLKNQAVEFKHHANELSNAVKKAKHVDAWVVAKAERATTDLSDITHYLEGQKAMKSGEKYSLGGMSREYNSGSGMSFDDIEVGETYYAYDTTLKKVVKVVVKDIMGKDYDPYNYEKEKVVYDVYDIEGDKLLRQEKVHDGGSSGTTSVTQKNGSINYLQTRISWRDYFGNFFKTKEDAEKHIKQGDDEMMADGGRIKYVDKNNIDYSRGSYPHYKRYNNAIGSFAWKYNNKYHEGILYHLDEYDKKYYAHLRLKEGEYIFRYKTDVMMGRYFPLVKINLKNALIYFLAHDKNEDDDKNPVFESRGIQSDYIMIEYNDLGIMFSEGGETATDETEMQYRHGGEVNLSEITDGQAIEHANKILISELGEGAKSLFFDSGYAARRFIREYHVRPVEITEEDIKDGFDDDSSMSDEAKEILQKYSDIKHNADTLAAMRSELEELGYTFDYDKDNVPYLLRENVSEEEKMARGGMMAKGGITFPAQLKEKIIENVKNGYEYVGWYFTSFSESTGRAGVVFTLSNKKGDTGLQIRGTSSQRKNNIIKDLIFETIEKAKAIVKQDKTSANTNIWSMLKNFQEEKPSIALNVLADGVSQTYLQKEYAKNVQSIWNVLSKDDRAKINEQIRKDTEAFQKYLVYEFVKLYYSDDRVREKCKGSSRTTITNIEAVMNKLAKDYPKTQYSLDTNRLAELGIGTNEEINTAVTPNDDKKIDAKPITRQDIENAIFALELVAETGNQKAKDAIDGLILMLEDYPEDSVASASGGNDEDYIIKMLQGKYYKVIPEGMQDSDIVVEIKDVRIDDPKYRDRFVSLISGKDGYADERIPLSKIDDFLNGEEIVLRDDKEYYAVKLMGNLAKGGIMAHGGQIESKRDELLDSLYPEIKELFAKNGLKLDEDYGFTDGSNKSYLPYFSHQRVGDTLQKVVVSYYEDGYEVIGEIEIELEDGIEIEVEFPSMGIKEKKEGFMAKGGMMAKGGEIVPYLLWVSKDGMKRELYGEYKSHRAAQMAMKKVWREGLDYQEIGITPKSEFQKYGYFKDGGMMKNVGATFAEKVNAISARLDGMIVPSRLRKDYGRRYNKAEAKLAAQRIAGAMRKKGY